MSDGGGTLAFAGLLVAAGPAAGWWTYNSIVNKYRNKSARYRPDQAVDYTVSSIQNDDHYVETKVSDNSSTTGRNEGTHDARLDYSKVTKE